MTGYLITITFGLLILGIMAMIFRFEFMDILYTVSSLIIFGVYLIYDT